MLNDVTARDAQMIEMAGQLGPAKGKDFDTGNILGPYILTADEVSHPASLNMEARVNGQRWGGGNSSEMHHNFADIIAFISKSETLISSGDSHRLWDCWHWLWFGNWQTIKAK